MLIDPADTSHHHRSADRFITAAEAGNLAHVLSPLFLAHRPTFAQSRFSLRALKCALTGWPHPTHTPRRCRWAFWGRRALDRSRRRRREDIVRRILVGAHQLVKP